MTIGFAILIFLAGCFVGFMGFWGLLWLLSEN